MPKHKLGDSNHSRPSKRSRNDDGGGGQKAFFTGMQSLMSTVPDAAASDFEDDVEAMEYLRSVRCEAGAIPHILVAPSIGPQRPSSTDIDDEDATNDAFLVTNGAYYEDGAYVSVENGHDAELDDEYDEDDYNDATNAYPEGEVGLGYGEGVSAHQEDWADGHEMEFDDSTVEPSEALLHSLRQSFLSLRACLRREPPPELVQALPEAHPPRVGKLSQGRPTFRAWAERLRTTDPWPVQVAAMGPAEALRLLRIVLGGKFLRVGSELRERTSRWVWALLARLPDRGELTSYEVAVVRDVGLRAVLLTRSVAEMAALRDEVEGGALDLGVNDRFDDSDEDEEAAKDMFPAENLSVVGSESQGNHASVAAVENGDDIEETDKVSPKAAGDCNEADTAQEVQDPAVPEAAATITTTTHAVPSEQQEDDAEEGEVSEDDEAPDCDQTAERLATSAVEPRDQPQETAEQHQEADGHDDVPMDLDGHSSGSEEVLAEIKARLLARLDQPPSPNSPPSNRQFEDQGAGYDDDEEETEATNRARMNMRATLNMIIMVAGEFYGQRDLLEFRDPFMGT